MKQLEEESGEAMLLFLDDLSAKVIATVTQAAAVVEKTHRGFGEEESGQPAMLLLPFLWRVVGGVGAVTGGVIATYGVLEL